MTDSPQKNVALITGASGGIGEAFARIHAKQGGDLVLAARSKDKLDALAAELHDKHGSNSHTIGIDLARPSAAQELVDELDAAGVTPKVDILINNAGFGGHGLFHERDWDADSAMIQLNIGTLTALTRFLLPGMVDRKRGRILNVASIAAYMPGPYQAVYFATKAYVLSFTQAIASELKGTGVTATALCPGYTETGFKAVADLDGTALVKSGGQTADEVAATGYAAMEVGKDSVVSGFANKFLSHVLVRMIPKSASASVAKKLQEK